MAKKYNGTINFASALRPTGAQPLDDRMVVQSLTDLMSVSTFEANGASAAYNGMMVAVLEEQKVFMLIDAAKLTDEKSWISVGSGNGSLSVNTLDEAKALATVDNRGQIIFVINENATYVVTGAATVMKLAASTADSIDELVAALQSDINTLKGAVGAKANGETAATGLYKEIADAQAAAATDAQGKADAAQTAAEATAEAALSAYKDEMNTALAGKVDTTTYNEKVQVIETAISGKVAQGDFDTLKGRVDTAEGEIDALQTAIATKAEAQALTDGLATKVNKADGYRLMSDAEGTKLEGIAAGAQVNVIEKIIFNGTEAIVDAQAKSVTLTTPADFITGLGTDEKVLSVADGKLTSTLSLNYYKGEGEDAGKYEIQLVGKENTVVGRIDAKDFVKDGMLNNVELKKNPENKPEGTYLVFTWNNADGVSEPMYVSVTDLIDVYEEGNGLALDGKKFSVNLKAGEEFLEVTEAGLATKGIATAITTAKNEVVGNAETDTKDSLTLEGVKKYAAAEADAAEAAAIAAAATDATTKANAAQAAAEATAAADATTKANAAQAAAIAAAATDAKSKADAAQAAAEGTAEAALTAYKGEMTTALAGKANVGDSYLKDEADGRFVAKEGFNEFAQEMETKLEGIEANAEVNVIEAIKVNGVDATVAEKLAEVTIDGTHVLVGSDIQGDVKNPETGVVSKETVYAANTTLASVLQGIQDSVSVAVSGGLTSVVAGNGVEVSAVASNKQTVSVKVSSAAGNMITADENGIYAAMYYDGDDTNDAE